MTADRLALAVRVMKARRRSICPACHCTVTVGNSIARLTDPPGWIHLTCVPIVRRLTQDLPATRGAAQEGTT